MVIKLIDVTCISYNCSNTQKIWSSTKQNTLKIVTIVKLHTCIEDELEAIESQKDIYLSCPK